MPGNNDQLAFKAAVKAAFLNVLQQRMHTARSAMDDAQASANDQDKSSAGDKYETSRAMGQIDRNMNAVQLQSAMEDYKRLEAIPLALNEQVAPGSLIRLDTGLFYAAAGLGPLVIDNITVFAISCQSPLYMHLSKKKKGDRITFGSQSLQLLEVY